MEASEKDDVIDRLHVLQSMLPASPMAATAREAIDTIQQQSAEIERLEREQRWQPIETAPKGRDVLVFYRNGLGKSRISRACYFRPNLPDDEEPYEGCVENGDGGEWLAPAAWYEASWADDESRCYAIEEAITHWMPLPPGPGETRPDPRDAELATLREVVGRLPKTADGVSAVPGMVFWVRNGQHPPMSFQTHVDEGWASGPSDRRDWSEVYSTRAAATAALESEADHA